MIHISRDGASGHEAPVAGGPQRLVVAVTAPESTHFLRGQLAWFRQHDFDVHLVASPGEQLTAMGRTEGVAVHPVPMARGMGLVGDVRSFIRCLSLMRRLRPQVVSAGTPKAGLLVTVTAALCGVPRRIYVLRGLRLEGARGWRRAVLWCAEWTACRAAHEVVCVSRSLREVAVHSGVVRRGKTTVIGAGSSNGVALERYVPDEGHAAAARELRRDLGIARDDFVIGYVGRLTRDKGLDDLREARDVLRVAEGAAPTWLVVGGVEDTELHGDRDTRVLGETDDVVTCYQAMDVLVLPTRREGFPNVVLEAACAEVPAVVTDATGAVDSVTDGITGAVVPVGDGVRLAEEIARLGADPARRRAMGKAARRRAEELFRPETIWVGLAASYRRRAGEGP